MHVLKVDRIAFEHVQWAFTSILFGIFASLD